MTQTTATMTVLAYSAEQAAAVALECAAEGTRPVANSTTRRTVSFVGVLPGATVVSSRPTAQTGSRAKSQAVKAALAAGRPVSHTVVVAYDLDAAVAAYAKAGAA